MNPTRLQLKKLADKYVHENNALTTKEYNILKESIYSHILEPRQSIFDTIVENAVEDPSLPVEEKEKHETDGTIGSIAMDRNGLRDLIDELEIEFDLDEHLNCFPDYDNVDMDKFRKFIAEYAANHIHDKHTLNQILKIVKKKNYHIYDILFMLYSAAGI